MFQLKVGEGAQRSCAVVPSGPLRLVGRDRVRHLYPILGSGAGQVERSCGFTHAALVGREGDNPHDLKSSLCRAPMIELQL